jgi:urease accessory protein
MKRDSTENHEDSTALDFLRLTHLADSALPIGALAHSFGLESLVSAGMLQPGDLAEFFAGYLQESGVLNAVACRTAFRLLRTEEPRFDASSWLKLNQLISARMPARESRAGSAALGRNFIGLVLGTVECPALLEAREASFQSGGLIHHSAAFGLVSAATAFEEDLTVLAFLQQVVTSCISTCQRLMPLGQTDAMKILWSLKPQIVRAARVSEGVALTDCSCFMPLLDWGAMEHPYLTTRLFIS